MVVLAAVGVLAMGAAAGRARGGVSAAPQSSVPGADSPRIPPIDPPPTPLGLPPRPTPTQVATAPSQPVGSLKPGDCLQLYPSKWADAYPVVDCAAPHIAQLLSEGVLPQPAGAPFPGAQALDTQVADLCAAPGMNWHWVAIWGEDVMTDLRYPNSAAQWATGDRAYYCFVYTYSRHELTGSAMPGS